MFKLTAIFMKYLKNRKLLTSWAGEIKNHILLVEMWGDYVNWKERRKHEGKWLVEQLKKHRCKRILDAALGDGCDALYLIKQGFEVVGNDFDILFIKKALENAEKYKVQMRVTNLDWRELTQEFEEESFDAVLCLGNSFTCLFGGKNQLKALKEFYIVLKKKGILIIDERNYQKILDNRASFLKGVHKTSGRYLYYGRFVHSRPVLIRKNLIKFELYDQRSKKKAYFCVYPFKRGELQYLLSKSGFLRIKKYSNYQEEENPDADVYTYVCEK
jgi:SAM-dependent methyltransferase